MAFCGHHEWKEEAAHATVPIAERMDRFKVGVTDCHSCDDALRHLLHPLVPKIINCLSETRRYVIRRRGIQAGVSDIACTTYPHDACSEFPWNILVVRVVLHHLWRFLMRSM